MRAVLLIVLVASASACDVYVVEPRYDSRNRIVGNFNVDEYSQTFSDYTFYSIYISKSSYSYDAINIDNFYASGIRVKAFVDYSRITIPYQIVSGYEIEGVGNIYGNTINFSYTVRDMYQAVPTDFCESEASMIY